MMNWSVSILFLVLFCPYVRSQSGTDLENVKTLLFTTNSYNTQIRPVTDQSNTVPVTVDFALVGINSFSDSDQKLITTGYLTIKWTDENLVWTPATYNNLASMLIPQNEVWKPDISLDNGLETKKSLGQKFIQVTVTSAGAVTWTPYEVFETSCSVDIVHFPYDSQTCDIKFINWMSPDSEVVFSHGSSGFYLSNFEKNGKWEIVSMQTSTETVSSKTILKYTLNLRRKSSFYVIFLILPSIVLALLNCFVFVLPAGSGEKVGYSIAVFLSYALFYTILSESLPKNSDAVSTIAAYLFFMMFLSTLSSVITLVELRIYNKPKINQLPRCAVLFTKFILNQKCRCGTDDYVTDDDIDGEWTKVIGPWLDCDWKDYVDALDFVLFWVFLIVTLLCTAVAIICAATSTFLF